MKHKQSALTITAATPDGGGRRHANICQSGKQENPFALPRTGESLKHERSCTGGSIISVTHHGRRAAEFAADKLKHLPNRVGNRARAAAGIKEPDRVWIGGHVFHHE